MPQPISPCLVHKLNACMRAENRQWVGPTPTPQPQQDIAAPASVLGSGAGDGVVLGASGLRKTLGRARG